MLKFPLPFIQNITNPALPDSEGTIVGVEGGSGPLAYLFSRLWQTITFLAAILVLVYMLWGALEWITSGGDTEKLKSARYKLTNAAIGLFILAMIFSIVVFLEFLFGFSLVEIKWPFYVTP